MDEEQKPAELDVPPVESRHFMDIKGRKIVVHLPLDGTHPRLFAVAEVDAQVQGDEPIRFQELLEIKETDTHWTGDASDYVALLYPLVRRAFDKFDSVLADNKARLNQKAQIMYGQRQQFREQMQRGIPDGLVDASGRALKKKG
jgi:hypothetical protein